VSLALSNYSLLQLAYHHVNLSALYSLPMDLLDILLSCMYEEYNQTEPYNKRRRRQTMETAITGLWLTHHRPGTNRSPTGHQPVNDSHRPSRPLTDRSPTFPTCQRPVTDPSPTHATTLQHLRLRSYIRYTPRRHGLTIIGIWLLLAPTS